MGEEEISFPDLDQLPEFHRYEKADRDTRLFAEWAPLVFLGGGLMTFIMAFIFAGATSAPEINTGIYVLVWAELLFVMAVFLSPFGMAVKRFFTRDQVIVAMINDEEGRKLLRTGDILHGRLERFTAIEERANEMSIQWGRAISGTDETVSYVDSGIKKHTKRLLDALWRGSDQLQIEYERLADQIGDLHRKQQELIQKIRTKRQSKQRTKEVMRSIDPY